MSKTLDFFKAPPKSVWKELFSLLTASGVFVMKPVVTQHETYQEFVIEQLQQHYSGGLLVLVNKDWPLISKLWITDLTEATTLLQDSYSTRGPAPRDPASMLRSFLLFLLTKPEIGITAWVDELYRVPLYAILSGFVPGDVPWRWYVL
jgi:urease accessory protein UreF